MQLQTKQSLSFTAKELKDYLGYRAGFATSRSEHEHGSSKGECEQRIPLITAHEIKLMPEDEILGFRSGMRPFRGKQLDYRRFPELVKRANMKPPEVPVLPGITVNPQNTPFSPYRFPQQEIPLFLADQHA